MIMGITTNVVSGVGAADADVMIGGEAPGKNEDLQREPSVDAATGLSTPS